MQNDTYIETLLCMFCSCIMPEQNPGSWTLSMQPAASSVMAMLMNLLPENKAAVTHSFWPSEQAAQGDCINTQMSVQ